MFFNNRPENLTTLLEQWQGNIYCEYTQKKWSAHEIRELTYLISHQLTKRGINEGDFVGICLTNTLSFPVILFSLIQLNTTPFLINSTMTESELNLLAHHYLLKWTIHDFYPGVSTLKRKIATDEIPIQSIKLGLIQHLHHQHESHTLPLKEVIIHPTSGTSGSHRYCIRSHHAAIEEGINYLQRITPYRQTSILVSTPLYHAFAFGFGLLSTLLSHSTLYLMPVFNIKKIIKLLQKERIEILSLVPPMIEPFINLSVHIKNLIHGLVFYAGAPCLTTSVNQFEELFHIPLYQIYGTTETGVISTNYSPDKKYAGTGPPLPNVIVNLANKEYYTDIHKSAGEVTIKSSSLMHNYLDTSLSPISFHNTLDLAYCDDNSSLHLIGRSKDIINCGGVKVDPADIEKALKSHKLISDAAVYPKLKENGQEAIQAAIVVTKEDVDIKEITKYCYELLSAHKIPQYYHFVSSIPKSPSGKCLKKLLPDYPQQLIYSRNLDNG